jgi:acetylornithine deacetylase/succinyl-diaminopimelate desuccinylase-like protein
MPVEQTLAELVSINSVSNNSNAEIIRYLAARCESLGLRVKLFPYEDEQNVEKVNMVAWAGTDGEQIDVELALVGHTDTVC